MSDESLCDRERPTGATWTDVQWRHTVQRPGSVRTVPYNLVAVHGFPWKLKACLHTFACLESLAMEIDRSNNPNPFDSNQKMNNYCYLFLSSYL